MHRVERVSDVLDRRARKRLSTLRALKSAALELTLERGLDNVTIDDIAERADVSRRTFFNYFTSKHDAIVGVSHDWVVEAAHRLRERPISEPPIVSLGHALSKGVEDADLVERWWPERNELIRRHPTLLAGQLGALVTVEDELTEALAERLGLDPDVDPYPRIAVVAAVAVLRSTMDWWHDGRRRGSRADALADAFDALARGLPAPSTHRLA